MTYHYKVYYYYIHYGLGVCGNCEYTSKTPLETGDDYNKLEKFISELIEGTKVNIMSCFPITKLSTKSIFNE